MVQYVNVWVMPSLKNLMPFEFIEGLDIEWLCARFTGDLESFLFHSGH